MFWSTNDRPVMMLGDDASLYHNIKVTEKSKGKAECSLFTRNGSVPACQASQERSVVRPHTVHVPIIIRHGDTAS